MFGKLVNNKIEYAPYYVKKGVKDIFNYNAESNSKMLISDGYKLILDSVAPADMKEPRKVWKETADKITATWVDDYVEPSLDDIKLAKRAEINQARDKSEQSGFEYLGKTFDSDPISCQRISCAAQAMSLSSGDNKITWTCQDNTTIELTKEQLSGLVGALAQHSNACHQKATKLKADVDKAKTAEQVEAIKWED